MKLQVLMHGGLGAAAMALVLSAGAVSAPARKPSKPAPNPDPYGRNLPDAPAAGFLPDSFVLARIQDRAVTVADYVDAYFNSYAELRPAQDSLGRTTFLKSMIHRDLLGLEARRMAYTLSFENRMVLREYSDRVYSNVLYERAVRDPVRVTDEDVRKAYEYYQHEVHVRHIVFSNRELGERVRRDLLAGRIGWSTAVKRYSIAPDREQEGDLGWQDAAQLGLDFASVIHELRPGETSGLVQSREGWDLIQCLERRPDGEVPAFDGVATLIRGQLQEIQSNHRADALQDTLIAELGLVIDSTNVRWAASRFIAASRIDLENGVSTMNIDAALPEFAPEDTSRVLARHRDGRLTLGEFTHAYSHHSPLMRPNVQEFWMMRNQVIATALDPYMSVLAIRRGIDKDPTAVRLVDRRYEEMIVERLYGDSVAPKVLIRPEERRRYYEKNQHQYVTFPAITYAAIVRESRAGIDSLAARIRAGEDPRAILEADSAAGLVSGSVQQRSASEQGTQYYRVLFEELRPGRFTITGPDKDGDYLLLHLLTRDDGRQLSYQESEGYISESLQNLRSEELLNAFLDRLRRRYRVDWRPDLVMRVEFKLPGT